MTFMSINPARDPMMALELETSYALDRPELDGATLFYGKAPEICFVVGGLVPSMKEKEMDFYLHWSHLSHVARLEWKYRGIAAVGFWTDGNGDRIVDASSVFPVEVNGDEAHVVASFERKLSDALAEAESRGEECICAKVGNVPVCIDTATGEGTREAVARVMNHMRLTHA